MPSLPNYFEGLDQGLFGKLKDGTVGTFTQFSKLLIENFYSGRCQHRPVTYLLNVRQEKVESLPDILKCFNNEALLVDEIDNKMALTAFIGGLQPT